MFGEIRKLIQDSIKIKPTVWTLFDSINVSTPPFQTLISQITINYNFISIIENLAYYTNLTDAEV